MAKLIQDIWHGDSAEMVKVFQKKKRVACVLTDPPFGVNNLSNYAETQEGKEYARKIANDESPEVAIEIFQSVMSELLPATLEHADAYVFTSYQVLSDWLVMTDEFMPQFGFNRKGILIWEKGGPGLGDLESPWGMGMEFILYFRKGRRPKSVQRRNSVIHVDKLNPNKLIHPHEKPTVLLEKLINASTNPGDLVVDPFAGSGSTVRAARSAGRSCIGIEYDEKNYKLAKRALDDTEDGLF